MSRPRRRAPREAGRTDRALVAAGRGDGGAPPRRPHDRAVLRGAAPRDRPRSPAVPLRAADVPPAVGPVTGARHAPLDDHRRGHRGRRARRGCALRTRQPQRGPLVLRPGRGAALRLQRPRHALPASAPLDLAPVATSWWPASNASRRSGGSSSPWTGRTSGRPRSDAWCASWGRRHGHRVRPRFPLSCPTTRPRSRSLAPCTPSPSTSTAAERRRHHRTSTGRVGARVTAVRSRIGAGTFSVMVDTPWVPVEGAPEQLDQERISDLAMLDEFAHPRGRDWSPSCVNLRPWPSWPLAWTCR